MIAISTLNTYRAIKAYLVAEFDNNHQEWLGKVGLNPDYPTLNDAITNIVLGGNIYLSDNEVPGQSLSSLDLLILVESKLDIAQNINVNIKPKSRQQLVFTWFYRDNGNVGNEYDEEFRMMMLDYLYSSLQYSILKYAQINDACDLLNIESGMLNVLGFDEAKRGDYSIIELKLNLNFV